MKNTYTVKRIVVTLILAVGFLTTLSAQRTAIVDINAILENFQDYKDAQVQIDADAKKWEQQIAQEFDKVKSLYNKYQAEQVLLSPEQKKEREDEIMEKENEVREMQKRIFGPEGELFKQRQNLIAPIQDKVFAAIRSYAKDRGYDLIFDKNSSAGLLYSSDDFDKTDAIKRQLGIR